MIEKEFQDLRSLLLLAANCKRPDQKVFEALLVPLQKDIGTITRAKEANRRDRDWLNHLSAVAEGGTCVGWVTIVSTLSIPRTSATLNTSSLVAEAWPVRR